MRTLLVMRPDAFERPGGDLVVAERAAAALARLDVHADIVATDRPDPRGYDVAHVYGLFDPESTARRIDAVRAHDVPLVLSPIWWDLSAFFTLAPRLEALLAQGPDGDIDAQLEHLRADEFSYRVAGEQARAAGERLRAQAALLRRVDVALPSSETEAHLLGTMLCVNEVPFVVTPLGIDDDAFAAPRTLRRSGVVCAGRVTPRKNQAALLYALRGLDVDVTIAGDVSDETYFALCRSLAGPRTRFTGRLPRPELRALLGRSAVHVLPSWAETPGLASLEAAAAGAHVVLGARGSEREYFGPDADYVDALDPAGIRAAVLQTLDRPPRDRGDALEKRLGARTWEEHAELVLEGYARALGRRIERDRDADR